MENQGPSACFFCKTSVDPNNSWKVPGDSGTRYYYNCSVCGNVSFITPPFEADIMLKLSESEKKIASIIIRNEWERNNRTDFKSPIPYEKLKKAISQHRPKFPLEKLNHALINLYKRSEFIGNEFIVNLDIDYPTYHCYNNKELFHIFHFLKDERFIRIPRV